LLSTADFPPYFACRLSPKRVIQREHDLPQFDGQVHLPDYRID
jgi:hypothetical protein